MMSHLHAGAITSVSADSYLTQLVDEDDGSNAHILVFRNFYHEVLALE